MGNGETQTDPIETEGKHILTVLGDEHLIGTYIPHPSGEGEIRVEEFPRFCGDHVRKIVALIESLDPQDPVRAQYIAASREALYSFLKNPSGRP